MKDYAAVLWDLDGTIVDTEPMWIAAEHELAAEHGAEWTHEDALQLVGNSLIASGEYIRTRLDLSLSAEQVVDYLVTRLVAALQADVPWRPGAVELITELSDRGMPQALVTMSYAPIAAPIVKVLPFQTVGHRRRGAPPQATSRPLSARRGTTRRVGGRLPRHRGLTDGSRVGQRRRVRRGRRAAHGARA